MMTNVLSYPKHSNGCVSQTNAKSNQATASNPDLLLGQQGQPSSSGVQNFLCLRNNSWECMAKLFQGQCMGKVQLLKGLRDSRG